MNFSVVMPESKSACEQIQFNDNDLCKVKYHFKYWLEPKGKEKTLTFSSAADNDVAGTVPGIGEVLIRYVPGNPLRVKFSFKAENNICIGFYFLGIEFPTDSSSLRLLPGVYSGYSKNGQTFKFNSVYDKSAGLYQMATAVDQAPSPLGTSLQEHQWLAMSFPPAYKDGVADLKKGQVVSGELVISPVDEDIWNPVHKKREIEQQTEQHILESHYSWQEYLKYWEQYVQQDDLWESLDDGMGMFHVGYYNLLKEPKLGGPFGYTLNGEKIRYKDVYDIAFGKHAGTDVVVDYFQDNTRQLEIAWGNGCNTMAAYSLYHYGGRSFKDKADNIVNAILHFKGNGFQIQDGPLKGSWINAYDAVKKRFQDHYGGQQIFLPDQGIVNYFLGKIYLEGFNRDNSIINAIRMNCVDFLLNVEKKYQTFPNAFAPDGSPGYSREGYLYDKPNAPGVAQTALSFIILYELTQELIYLREAERIIEYHLMPLIAENNFGFLEYDHLDYCSAGACSILIALAEYLELQEAKLKSLVSRIQEKVLYHLLSFRHEHDYYVYSHSHNVDGWGARAITQYGFLHGFTRGSAQGEYMLHVRYEYGYALLRTWQTSQSTLAKSALINYLNYLTWQQFVNPELKKGFGGVTEHTGLKTYIQDTTHLVHSTPLPLILAVKLGLK